MHLIETGERLPDYCKGDHKSTFHAHPGRNWVYERSGSRILLSTAGKEEEAWLDLRMSSA